MPFKVPSNVASNGGLPEVVIVSLEELRAQSLAPDPTAACGPGLYLTPSEARHSGAVWYPRKVNVREGFDVYFDFEISQPSQKCTRMDDVNTYCRSRGADGIAFVMQDVSEVALGLAGNGLGYGLFMITIMFLL